jgi:hypothetical protein
MERELPSGGGGETTGLLKVTTPSSREVSGKIGLYVTCYNRPAKHFPVESNVEELRGAVAGDMRLPLDEVHLLNGGLLLDDKTNIAEIGARPNIRAAMIYEERRRPPPETPTTTRNIIVFVSIMAVPLLVSSLLGLLILVLPPGVQNFLGNYSGVVGMLITYAWFSVFGWYSLKTGSMKYSFRPN